MPRICLPHEEPTKTLTNAACLTTREMAGAEKRVLLSAINCSLGRSCACAQALSCVRVFATLWTVACQAPLSMGIPKSRILEWVAMPHHALLQEIFSTQGSNSGLPHCWQILYHMSHQESPYTIIWSCNPTPCRRKNMIWKDICTPAFIAALFTTAKIWKQPKCPSIEEWIKKMWYI